MGSEFLVTHPARNMTRGAHYEQFILTGDLSLKQGVDQFILMARVEGRSRKTLENYRWSFGELGKFIGDPLLSEINALTIRHYIAHLQGRNLSHFTISMHDKNLRTLFKWLYREKLTPHNPMLDVGKPRVPKKIPQVLDGAQVQELLKVCDRKNWFGFRDYVIVMLMLDCGSRRLSASC